MNADQLAKIYRDTPAIRHRFDEERFRALSNEKMDVDSAFAPLDEHRAAALKVQLPVLEKNEFGGIAAAYNVKVDAWMPTILETGAFAKSLSTPSVKNRVKVLYQHSVAIGVPTFMSDLPEGLAVVGKVSQTSLGADTLTLLRDGVMDEMSVGFTPTEYYFKEKDGELWRHITEGELWEFSVVSRGANRGAKITVVNSALSDPRLDQILTAVQQMRAPAAAKFDFEAFLQSFEQLTDEQLKTLGERLAARRPEPTIDVSAELSALADLERYVSAEGT